MRRDHPVDIPRVSLFECKAAVGIRKKDRSKYRGWIEMAMNRRRFLKNAAAGAALAGMGGLGGLFIPFAEAVEVPKFNFAHITDLHLDVSGENSMGQYREKSVTLFIGALQQLIRLPKLKFVVFGGDQIHYGPRDKESLTVFQEWTTKDLSMPLYILLGNTEVSPITGVSKLGRDDYLKAWADRGLRPGHSSWAFDPVKSVRVIGFDVTVDGSPHGEASVQELKWLENELKTNKSRKLIIIFTHQLLMPTTPRDSREWSFWMVKNHARVREVIEAHPNVRLVVSGHHHASKVETVGKVTYVSDPAVVTYPCSFRAYSVTGDGIHLWNVGVNDKAIVNRARDLLVADPYARMYDPAEPQKVADYSIGLTQKDRETTIKL
jgi:3',5'-cyclic AMP phosphodiesterase CpdA